jgi:hypothetical protein
MSKINKRSKLAVSLSALYLLVIIASLVMMLITEGDTSMSAIYLVMVTMPWAMVLSPVQKLLQIDSMIFATVFLVIGGIFNTTVLYHMLSFVTGGYRS